MDATFCKDDDCLQLKIESSIDFPPIAIVGMGMRLPGDVRSAEEFWKFVMARKNGVGRVPSNRYNVDAFYDPERPQSIKTQQGHFLSEDPAYFDASFFSISASEASNMDPELRLLLEVVWECLENAGETGWEGKNIGCFVGTFGEDWLTSIHQDQQAMNRYYAVDGAFSLANAISYRYNFTGPSMTVLSACSSSLVCVHEACQNLTTNACDSAVVAGSNLIFTPAMTRTMSENGVLSESGLCRTFDAKADGYGRAEGINALYLKRLVDAVQAGDPIRAVIRSTAANSDGKSASIFAPSKTAQQSLIQQAYRRAGIQDIGKTGLFECHGTGTQAGDIAETSALAELLAGKGGILGAAKPNFGHSEGASGITGLIKALLSLEKRTIPPVAHFDTPNPAIPFEAGGLLVPAVATSWPEDRLERASINGFGIGGANAHVILESVAVYCNHHAVEIPVLPETKQRLLVVSAQSKESLISRIAQINEYLTKRPEQMQNLVYTLGVRRKHLSHRGVAVIDSSSILEPKFETMKSVASAQIVFIFTGQGAQWAGMGNGLMRSYSSVREDIRQLDQVLSSLADAPSWSLEDELSKEDSTSVNSPELSQPLCTAVQICLVNHLAKWGIRPSSVIGHSSGEIAAAYAAGAVPARTAIVIAYFRGKMARLQIGCGEMMAIGLSRDEAMPYLDEGVCIACENSPKSVTLSGDVEMINSISTRIQIELPDTFCRVLGLGMAYHSPQMKSIGEKYVTAITDYISFNATMLPLFSSVTKERITNPVQLDACYWQQNLESPVLFSGAVTCALQDTDQSQIFVEIGPHSALAAPVNQIFQAVESKKPPFYVPTLERHRTDAESQLMSTASKIFIRGGRVDLQAINGTGTVLTNLPNYPWQHKAKYWYEGRLTNGWRFQEFSSHELLGTRCAETTDLAPSWRNLLRLEDVPWISDHVLQGEVVFPGAGYIAMAGEAVRQLSGYADFTVQNVIFHAPLMIEASDTIELVTSLMSARINDLVNSKWFNFAILSYENNSWTKLCSGQVGSGGDDDMQLPTLVKHSRPVSPEKWYAALSDMGLEYGSRFRGLEEISADPNGNKACATATQPVNIQSHYAIHPIVIDLTFQLLSVAAAAGLPRRMTKCAIPASIGKLYVGKTEINIDVSAEIVVDSRGVRGNATATACDNVVLQLTQGLFFVLERENKPAQTQGPLAAQLEWRPDIDFQEVPSLLPESEARLKGLTESMRSLEDATVLHILEMAGRIEDVDPSTTELSKWKSWIKAQASRAYSGRVQSCPKAQEWAMMTSSQRINVLKHCKSICETADDGSIGPYIAMERIFDKCVDILEGRLSALEIFTEDRLFERYYSFPQPWAEWGHFLKLLAHSNPCMRILEIGAGTGSATVEALKHIERSGRPAYSKYTWTDISPTLVTGAQEKFQSHINMEYRVLDISKSPKEQGFHLQQYDLVIASNVLHATPSLYKTLVHTRELLAPKGRLLLHELNPDWIFIDFCMGTMSGWWIGSQDDRPDVPYIGPERWNFELKNAGFTGVETAMNDMKPPLQVSCTMISRLANTAPVKPDVALIDLSSNNTQRELLKTAFIDLGYKIKPSTIHEPPKPNEWIVILDVESSFLRAMSSANFDAVKNYMAHSYGSQIIWVTTLIQTGCSNPDFGLVLGFARTLRRELRLDLATLEVESFDLSIAKALEGIMHKMSWQKSSSFSGPDYEFCLREGSLNVGRYFWGPLEPSIQPLNLSSDLIKLQIRTPGLLNTLGWQQFSPQKLGDHDVEVDMHYLGLNFKDVMTAMGFVGTTDEIGIEGSGIVRSVGSKVTSLVPGQQVIAFGTGIFQSSVVVNQRACVKFPSAMSLEEAGGTIAVFATALYALINLAQLKKGQAVLIHSACGGVGLAAIQICKAIGAEIYATVGTKEKIEYLNASLGIPSERIFDSRSTTFKPALMKITHGRGVDVVLNSLAGELLHASWDCVAPFGKFIELGKRDMLTNGMLNLKPFSKNRTFFGLDMNAMFELSSSEASEGMMEQFHLWWREGKIKPIGMRTVFAADQAPEAFRTLQKGTHIGKILLKMPERGQPLQAIPIPRTAKFAADVSYLLVGGFGGIGRAVATWLVERGARHLTILSRSAGISAQSKSFISELQTQGCYVHPVAGDVTDASDVQRAIAACEGRLKGVIQMSLCLRDNNFTSMTLDEWSAALAPKVQGTWNLHNATLDCCLEFFVVFGSMSGACGREGQANYAAANTFLNAFANYRRQLGLPATALELGVVGDTGLVSRNNKWLHGLRAAGVYILKEADVLNGLELSILHSQSCLTTNSGATVGASYMIGAQYSRPISDPTVRPYWNAEAPFASYIQVESMGPRASSKSNTSNIKRLLSEAEKDPSVVHRKETAEIVSQEVCELITMHLPEADNMDHEEKLTVQIDSLMSIEVRNWIRRTLNFEVSLSEIGRAKTVGGLSELLCQRLKDRFPVDQTEFMNIQAVAQASL